MSQHDAISHWVQGLSKKLDQILAQGKHIMSAITEYVSRVETYVDQTSTKFDDIKAGIANLDALITAFQNSPGTLEPDDQKALDGLETAVKALLAKAGTVDVTPPVPPAKA